MLDAILKSIAAVDLDELDIDSGTLGLSQLAATADSEATFRAAVRAIILRLLHYHRHHPSFAWLHYIHAMFSTAAKTATLLSTNSQPFEYVSVARYRQIAADEAPIDPPGGDVFMLVMLREFFERQPLMPGYVHIRDGRFGGFPLRNVKSNVRTFMLATAPLLYLGGVDPAIIWSIVRSLFIGHSIIRVPAYGFYANFCVENIVFREIHAEGVIGDVVNECGTVLIYDSMASKPRGAADLQQMCPSQNYILTPEFVRIGTRINVLIQRIPKKICIRVKIDGGPETTTTILVKGLYNQLLVEMWAGSLVARANETVIHDHVVHSFRRSPCLDVTLTLDRLMF